MYANIEFLKRLVVLLSAYLAHPDPTPQGKLFITAVCSLGTDASPNDVAPDEYGCAETVDTIHKKAFGLYVGGRLTLSTAVLYSILKTSRKWRKVDDPTPGCIVISPTGYGSGALSNGHVGIVSADGKIMSNTSATGRFEENYTLDTWRKRYVAVGGFPMDFFQKVEI